MIMVCYEANKTLLHEEGNFFCSQTQNQHISTFIFAFCIDIFEERKREGMLGIGVGGSMAKDEDKIRK